MQNHASQSSTIAAFNLHGWSQEYNIFTSEPSTYYNRRRWKPFFSVSFRHSLGYGQLFQPENVWTQLRKWAAATDTLPVGKPKHWNWRLWVTAARWRVPWLFAYLHLHVFVCDRERWCNPPGKIFTLVDKGMMQVFESFIGHELLSNNQEHYKQ